MSFQTSLLVRRDHNRDDCLPASIFVLPNELLCLVLTAVSCIEPPLGLYSYIKASNIEQKRNQALGVLRLSEVCTRFRTLLLSMPAVWAAFAFELPVETARLALSRSKSVPITANIREPSVLLEHGVDHAHIFALVTEHAARIRLLTVYELEFEQFKNIFHRQLPCLEKIDISYNDISMSEHVIGDVCIDAPTLRFARLASQPLVVDGPTLTFKLPALASLELAFSVSDQDTMHILHCVVDVLQSSPLIEHLKLTVDTEQEEVHWDTLFYGRNFKLAHLWSLELEARCTADLACFFRGVCISQPTRLGLSLTYLINIDEKIVPSVNEFSSLLQNPSHDGLWLSILHDGECHGLDISTFPASDDAARLTVFAKLRIYLNDPDEELAYLQLANTFAAAFAQNRVRQLELFLPESGVWAAVLQPITATCTGATDLLIDHEKDRNSTLFASTDNFPALDTLHVHPFMASCRQDAFYVWWQALVAWLGRRVQAGVRVRRLRVLRPDWCGPSTEVTDFEKEMFARAAEFVQEVLN